jgi:hypothetical protein
MSARKIFGLWRFSDFEIFDKGYLTCTCISGYGKFRGCQYPAYPNGCCRTLVDPRLAIKVDCLLTLFLVIFANMLGARTDFACWNAAIGVVTAANEAVPGRSECS